MSVRETEMSDHGTGRRMDTRDITMIAVCTAMMVICSWISIPATVPFTMQTFGVFLCVGLLGGRRGTLAVSVYLLLGAVGLPVFSGFTGGIGHLFGATGGYIIGFLFSALVMWLIERLHGRSIKTLVLRLRNGMVHGGLRERLRKHRTYDGSRVVRIPLCDPGRCKDSACHGDDTQDKTDH